MNPAKAKITRREEAFAQELRDEERTNEEEDLPAPPDGGYGWVIVLASFMCNMVVDGVSYCFGIFLPGLVLYYGETKSKTAWIGSILTGMTMGAGPVVSLLVNRYGCRATCIAGSVLGAASFALSVFCPTVETLMVLYGFLGGLGFGLIYLPAIVCVGYYFESKRSLATGIAVCGSGVGTFAFAPVAAYLVKEYGWKGANLFIAGVILCCVVFGALMKPLEYPEKKAARNGIRPTPAKASQSAAEVASVYNSKMSISSRKSHVVQPLSRKDIFYSGSVLNLKEYQSQKSLDKYRHSIHNIPHNRYGKGKSCLPESVRNILNQLVDVSLLKDPIFMFIGFSNFFGMAALYVPFVYIVDCAVQDGISDDRASMLISILGITNTIARVICGYFADFPQINSLLVNNICLLMAAASVAVAPFCHTYATYTAMCIFFALAIAGYISLTSIVLVDLLGLDKLTNSFGLLILFRGAAAFVGSPLAGALRDATQSYDVPFFVAGALFLVSALLSFAVPIVQRCKRKNVDEEVDDEATAPMNVVSES